MCIRDSPVGCVAAEFQAHDVATGFSAPETALHRLHQILGLLLLEGEIGVTGDTEETDAADPASWKEGPEVVADHLLERDAEVKGTRAFSVQGHRKGDPARNVLCGKLQVNQFVPTEARTLNLNGEVEAQAADEGEWFSRGIQSCRRKDRLNLGLEITGQPILLTSGQLWVVQDGNASLF